MSRNSAEETVKSVKARETLGNAGKTRKMQETARKMQEIARRHRELCSKT